MTATLRLTSTNDAQRYLLNLSTRILHGVSEIQYGFLIVEGGSASRKRTESDEMTANRSTAGPVLVPDRPVVEIPHVDVILQAVHRLDHTNSDQWDLLGGH